MVNILNKELLISYIDNYSTNISDKKKTGSVFTNSTLIDEMLNKLPAKVWKDETLKWLDTGCGIGNYHIIVYYKLMENIPIKDEEERRKHIIENMLYFIEYNTYYVNDLRNIFISDKYNLNIFNGSYFYLHTLEENIPIYNEETFGTEFNIILGNPPYQKINMKNPDKLSAKPLYHLFVKNSIDKLKEDGYLLYIHPVSWRRKSKEIKIINDILSKKLLYIYTNNAFTGFGTSAPYINYYLLQNTLNDDKFLTKYETIFNNKKYEGKIHLNKKLEYIPVFLTKETISIINKVINTGGEKFDVQLESKLSTEKKNISINKDEEFKYLNLHTYSKKNGRIYRYSNKKHPCHDKLKIIMNFKGGHEYLKPFIDERTMGITDNSMRLYVTDENKDFLLSYFNSDILKFLLICTTYNYGRNGKNEFHIINTFTMPKIQDFYKFYGITYKEILFIRNLL